MFDVSSANARRVTGGHKSNDGAIGKLVVTGLKSTSDGTGFSPSNFEAVALAVRVKDSGDKFSPYIEGLVMVQVNKGPMAMKDTFLPELALNYGETTTVATLADGMVASYFDDPDGDLTATTTFAADNTGYQIGWESSNLAVAAVVEAEGGTPAVA